MQGSSFRLAVSIIIPCFNGEEFVGDAIRSALAQTYPHKEVIVVDDGSTDGSLDVIKSFGDAIRWETGPNRGGSAARNRGLALAMGEVIQFLDADDLLNPDKLRLQVPLLLTDRRFVVYCSVAILDLVTGAAMGVLSPGERDDFRRCCFDRISTPAPVHWREAIQQVGGFDETLPCAQEFDLHLRMACAGMRFHHIPEVLVSVRRRRNSVSSDYVRVLYRLGGIVQRAAGLLRVDGPNCNKELRALSEVLAQAAVRLIDRGHVRKGTEYLVLAREIHLSGGMGIFRPLRRIGYRALGVERAHPLLRRLARIRERMSRGAPVSARTIAVHDGSRQAGDLEHPFARS